MKIAMIAPIAWRTPPRAYGPWELVTSLLTEALVAKGVDVTLFATLDAVKDTPEIAQFQFRATNQWIGGTHSRSTIHDFHGAMQEMAHPEPRTFDADHPAVLVMGQGRAFSGRADRNEPMRPAFDLPVDVSAEPILVESTVFERRHQRGH